MRGQLELQPGDQPILRWAAPAAAWWRSRPHPNNHTDRTGQLWLLDLAWFVDLGETAADVSSGDWNAVRIDALSIGAGLAVETLCNFVLGLADIPTAGMATVAGELGCFLAGTLAAQAVKNELEE